MCSTCIKLRKAAFAVIRTVLPKPKEEDADKREVSSAKPRDS